MKTGYLDCFSGISGDMLLGAFLDAGWDKMELEELPRLLGFGDIDISTERVTRGGISAVLVNVNCSSMPQAHRRLSDLCRIVVSSALDADLKEQAVFAFEMLAEAEARVHSISKDEVHFHETGGIDAIIDVTGCLWAKSSLGLEKIVCSPLPLSRGLVQCEHGVLPLPAPAVLELLSGKEVYFVDEDRELVTPTGALMAIVLSDAWAELPRFEVESTGYGAGSMKLGSRPNLLRLIMGNGQDPSIQSDEVMEIRTVIDDMNPEYAGYFLQSVFAKRALDAWISPLIMKKNRPGFEICVIARPEDYRDLSRFILSCTTTSGLRIRRAARLLAPRHEIYVKTRWGVVRAKAILRPGGKREVVPEFEACRIVAEKHDVSIRDVYVEVLTNGEAGLCKGRENGRKFF